MWNEHWTYRQARIKVVNETSQSSERYDIQMQALMKQKKWLMLCLMCLLLELLALLLATKRLVLHISKYNNKYPDKYRILPIWR